MRPSTTGPSLRALTPCTNIWGGNEVVQDDPVVDRHSEAVYCPFPTQTLFDQDREWGLYRPDGHLIDSAAYYRGGYERRLIGQSPRRSFAADALPRAPAVTYIYVGPIIPQYGHFLVSSLSRLWYVLGGAGRGAKLLAHAHTPPEIWFHVPYMRETLGRLGLTAGDFAWFSRPTRLGDVIVPRTSFEEQCFAHRSYGRVARAVGATIPAPEGRALAPAYLSKELLPAGYQRIANESAIIAVLRDAGIDIIHPETMPFEAQVAIFRERRVVIGMASSLLHTSAFAGDRSLTIGLTAGHINSNLTLADAVTGREAIYLEPRGGGHDVGPKDGFHRNIMLVDPAGIGRDLADLAWHHHALRR